MPSRAVKEPIQFRPMLHTSACWLPWSPRNLMPLRSTWRAALSDTPRLRLVKLAIRVIAEDPHLPFACPGSPAQQRGQRPDHTPGHRNPKDRRYTPTTRPRRR